MTANQLPMRKPYGIPTGKGWFPGRAGILATADALSGTGAQALRPLPLTDLKQVFNQAPQ